MNKRLACAAVLAAATLLGGCAVYPAYPAYAAAPQVVAPAPVYVAPAPVYVGPAFYPSISIYGRYHRR